MNVRRCTVAGFAVVLIWALLNLLLPAQPRITLHVRDADVQSVLRDIARQSNTLPALDPHIRGLVTVQTTATGARLPDLMDALCTAYSCRWSVTRGPEPVLIVRQKEGKEGNKR